MRNNYKIGILGTLGRFMCFFFAKSGSFHVLRHKADSWSFSDVTFIQERVCACGYRKRERYV